MPKDPEKYQYFTVGLLKESFALEALKADAVKHHMIDQPAKLIALRLTEYYDLLSRAVPTFPGGPFAAGRGSDVGMNTRLRSPLERGNSPAGSADEDMLVDGVSEDDIVGTSTTVEQNVDEAADYWAIL
jgi:hypothetical protein